MPGYIDPKFRDGPEEKPATWGGLIKGTLAALALILAAGVAVIAFIWNALEQQTNYSPF